MAIKTAVLAGLVVLPLVSLGLPASDRLTISVTFGSVSVTYVSHKGVEFDLDPTCYVTPCPLAALHVGRQEAPLYPTMP